MAKIGVVNQRLSYFLLPTVRLGFQSFGAKAAGLVRRFCGFRDAKIDTTRAKGRNPYDAPPRSRPSGSIRSLGFSGNRRGNLYLSWTEFVCLTVGVWVGHCSLQHAVFPRETKLNKSYLRNLICEMRFTRLRVDDRNVALSFFPFSFPFLFFLGRFLSRRLRCSWRLSIARPSEWTLMMRSRGKIENSAGSGRRLRSREKKMESSWIENYFLYKIFCIYHEKSIIH